LNQIKIPKWIGAFQVQVTNSMFYLSLFNTAMLMVTFWFTSGYQVSERYLSFMNLWLFLILVIVLFAIIAIIDYKFIYPSRQAFVNEQACKHENPAMNELAAIRSELKELREEIRKWH
jgi:type III secretory pathway component EscU